MTLEAARTAKELGMKVIMGAPNVLRGHSHSGNLSAMDAIAEGLVDLLASDYYPPAMLAAAHKLHQGGKMTLSEAINLISFSPAQACGLTDRGEIAVGKRADLVVATFAPALRVRQVFRSGKQVWSSGPVEEAHVQ